MAVTFDFEIIRQTTVPGISLVLAQNEDAFNYLTEEAQMTTLADGSAPISTNNLPDFVDDVEQAQMCCVLAS